MRLSELRWRKLVESGRICIDTAAFTRSGGAGPPGVVVYRYNNNNTYTILDYCISPRREWSKVDELTAECILIELTKSPRDAEDHPER